MVMLNPTLNLRSTELENMALSLVSAAENLQTQSRDRSLSWDVLSRNTDAESLLAGFNRLALHNSPLAETATRMLQVSQVLRDTASMIRILEGYLAALEKVTNRSITVTLLLRQIAGLGDVMDFMCARQITALCTAIIPEPVRRLTDFDDLPVTAIHEFNLMNAPPEVHQLATDNPDITLLEVGDGNLVAAIGDIDSAEAVATVVAGVGSSEPSQWNNHMERARTIHRTTGAATIMWLGYAAPASIPVALSDRAARSGAQDLRSFQAALAARRPEQRRVVVGYSYGAAVVGNAASTSSRGFDADALVLVGSPGAGVQRASDLHLNSDEPGVYAVTGSRDPIGFAATGLGGVHGADPTAPWFGATVWESTSHHSGYWSDPHFLEQLGGVVRK